MKHAPITKQRSSWRVVPGLYGLGQVLRRNVSDGQLTAIVAEEPLGWHLSISFDRPGGSLRYPTWDEIMHARSQLLPADVAFVMHLPVESEFVAVHDTCFHLHEHPERAA